MDSAIEISSGSSSSGSGSDEEESPESIRQHALTRNNPSWLRQRGSTSNPQRGSSAGSSHGKAVNISNASSRNGDSSYASRPRDSTGNGNTQQASSQQTMKRTLPQSFNTTSLHPRSANSISNGNGNTLNSRNSSEGPKPSSQQSLKRTLPPSFSQAPFTSRSANSMSNGNGGRFGAYYDSAAVGNNMSNFGDGYRGTHGEIGIHRGIGGVRILPPSLAHGASSSSMSYAGLSDPMHRNGIADDRNSENDERLVYQAALQDLNQPKTEDDLPPGTLSVPLMRHQKIALAWMFQKEAKSTHCSGGILADDQGLGKTVSTIALILKEKLESQLNSEISSKHQEAVILDLDADDESENVKPELKVSSNNETTGLSDDESDRVKVKDEEASTSTQAFNRKRPAAGTLIVCPASVVRQWARELDEKISYDSKLSVLVYHGGNRTKDPNELAKYDVVVTTYAIVNNEVPKQPLADEDENDEKNTEIHGLAPGFSNYKKRKVIVGASKKSKKRGKKSVDDSSFYPDSGALARVVWLRIVLDEAQTIKNHRTQVARACCGLRAKRRWCLSGTPIQNQIDDLYSYFRFLRYNPYAVYKSFCHIIKNQVSKNPLHGYKKLQAVLRAIMLRRTKGTLIDGQPIINLPPKKLNLSKVDFSAEERSFYQKLESESQSQFKAYADAGTLNQNYANILLMLLRLRQACDHPTLAKGYSKDPLGKVSSEAAKRLPREARINLLNRLKSAGICQDCDDTPDGPVVTLCGHVFCFHCAMGYINGEDNTCPVPRCREDLGRDVIFSESSLRKGMAYDSGASSSQDNGLDRSVSLKSEFSSSKVKAVLEILQRLSKQGSSNSEPYDDDDDVTIVEPTSVHSSSPREEGPVKTIIFSQWTGMLDLIEPSLLENGIEFRRLDGTMSLAARDRAIKEFSNDPDVTVILMSLKAGNLGLNMVAACHVILLDLWWNPTTEDQAIDRAHRIGQTRPVTVTRITIKDTVEDKILKLQEDKRKMVASAFGEEHGGSSATRLTVDDLKYLFTV